MNKFQRDIYLEGSSSEKTIPNNSIFTIAPYKWNGIYVFDFPEWGTIKEAFVGGATEFLEIISNNANSMVATFSENPFPDAHRVDIIEEDGFGGTYYFSEEYQHKLWLCSYLKNFFKESPKSIYISVKPIN